MTLKVSGLNRSIPELLIPLKMLIQDPKYFFAGVSSAYLVKLLADDTRGMDSNPANVNLQISLKLVYNG